jgi:hypothetical protein
MSSSSKPPAAADMERERRGEEAMTELEKKIRYLSD